MVKTLDSNQTPKIDRSHIQPIYFVHVNSLYWSDRNFTYNNHNYEAYLKNLSNIESQIRNLGGNDNSQITLEFLNDKILTYNYLIEYFDVAELEGTTISIYKLLVDTNEIFDSDVSTLIYKGVLGQPYDITKRTFKVDANSRLFAKNNNLPLDVIDLADFSEADPDDVGKYRNILYGSLKKVVCPWTVAGWLSTLTADITSSATSIEVSDGSNTPGSAFSALIDNEEIYVTSGFGTNTLTATRGYGGTTAAAHNKGAKIYHKRTDFEAEIAMHPVKSIGDVYAKVSNEWLRIVSGVTKHTDSGGRAKLVFSDKVKYEEKTNQTSSLGTEPHNHDLSEPTIYVKKECVPTGSSGPTGHENVRDGNQDTYCAIDNVNPVSATFTESDLGTINRQYVWVFKCDTGNDITIQCPSGTTILTAGGGASGWIRAVKTGGAWTNAVVVIGASTGNQIGEIYKEVEYTPGATTVDNKTLTPSLSGNSVANMVIGDIVACDVEGQLDDGSGTYTGTPNALIERPDHVRKHILIARLGFASGDIDSSFGTVGTIYAGRISGGYKFAFVLHEVATETLELFRQMDFQTRSVMFESQGVFKLAFSPTTTPTSQKTFDENNIRDDFVFSKTDFADIRNKIRAHYFRDYSKLGNLSEKYMKVNEDSDSTSISRYGEKSENYEFSCIGNLSDMVDDVLEWILHELKEIKKRVEFKTDWDAMILEGCDYFTVTSDFWSGNKFRTIRMNERPEDQIIEIGGIEYVA